jgi:hypothetical protein
MNVPRETLYYNRPSKKTSGIYTFLGSTNVSREIPYQIDLL